MGVKKKNHIMKKKKAKELIKNKLEFLASSQENEKEIQKKKIPIPSINSNVSKGRRGTEAGSRGKNKSVWVLEKKKNEVGGGSFGTLQAL